MAEQAQAIKTGGDDLDDGLEYDQDLLADSDAEAEDAVSGAGSDIDELGDDGAGVDASVDDSREVVGRGKETEVTSPVVEGKKRKLEDVDVEEDSGDDADQKKAEKKRIKKEKEKARKAKKRETTDQVSANTSPSHLSPESLSALLLRSIRESYPSASAIELEEKVIPQSSLLPAPAYPAPKADPNQPFKDLQERIVSLSYGKKAQKGNGTPGFIILALSGTRCADVVRGVRDVKAQGEVAKLFAKHFKLADQVKYLEKTNVSIAVGTPARVGKLLAEGALRVTKDTVLLLDIAHQDSKTRTILTLPEVRDELWKSVFGDQGRQVLLGRGAKIGAF